LVRNSSRKILWLAASMFIGVLAAGSARAVPMLQLYVENATYQSGGWYTPSQSFRLWAIGDLAMPGGSGFLTIDNLRLAAVYDDPGDKEVTITITPTKIGGINVGAYGGFVDPSISPAVQLTTPNPVTDGSTPMIGPSRHLPSHGEYGKGKVWQEFALGAFSQADSQLGDFVNTFPTPAGLNTAQIHAYDVIVQGAYAHFDLYGQVTDSRGRVSYVFAPPGHDATDGPEASVPLPATLALLLIGALGLGVCRRGTRAV
jgi:hypothetical protein